MCVEKRSVCTDAAAAFVVIHSPLHNIGKKHRYIKTVSCTIRLVSYKFINSLFLQAPPYEDKAGCKKYELLSPLSLPWSEIIATKINDLYFS